MSIDDIAEFAYTEEDVRRMAREYLAARLPRMPQGGRL